jgi:hypothetical protein
MRYHHLGGCYGHGGWYAGHCGPGPGYGPGWGYGWDAPADEPRPHRLRRGRFGGAGASRATAATQLESYLASLRDEIRAIEQDLHDLQAEEGVLEGEPKA